MDRYAISAQERPQVVRVDIAGGEGAQPTTEVKAHRCEGSVPGQYYVGVGDVGRFLTVLYCAAEPYTAGRQTTARNAGWWQSLSLKMLVEKAKHLPPTIHGLFRPVVSSVIVPKTVPRTIIPVKLVCFTVPLELLLVLIHLFR